MVKHLCLRSDGKVIIIPDVTEFYTDIVGGLVWVHRVGRTYPELFANVSEISSPYKQRTEQE